MMSTLKLLGIMFCRFNFFQFFSIEELHVHSSSRKRCVISSFCILQNEQLSLSLILIFYKWPAVVIATCNTPCNINGYRKVTKTCCNNRCRK